MDIVQKHIYSKETLSVRSDAKWAKYVAVLPILFPVSYLGQPKIFSNIHRKSFQRVR
jgi:hypothetical protein